MNKTFYYVADTEAQTVRNDTQWQELYANEKLKKTRLTTKKTLIENNVIPCVNKESNVKKISHLTNEHSKVLASIRNMLCEDMTTYLLGYAPVYTTKARRNSSRQYKQLIKYHERHKNQYNDFESCEMCHRREASQVRYFEDLTDKGDIWLNMLEEISKKHKSAKGTKGDKIVIFFHNLDYDIQSFLETVRTHSCIKILENKSIYHDSKIYKCAFMYKGFNFEFCDSLKLYNQPLADLASLVGWEKQTEDATYTWFKLDPWSETYMKERRYFQYDIAILKHVMEMHFFHHPNQKFRYTASSYAEAELKACVKNDLKKKYGVKKMQEIYANIFRPKTDFFTPDFQDFVRSAYYGGFVYADKDHINKIVRRGIAADVNSLYPSVMLNRNYPDYTSAEEIRRDDKSTVLKTLNEENQFAIFKIRITKLELKEKGVPCFPKNAGYGLGRDIFNLDDLIKNKAVASYAIVNLTNIDLKHVLKNYNIKWSLVFGVKFNRYFERPFKSFVLKHKKEKEDAVREGNMAKKLIAKLTLNSAYGKFAQREINQTIKFVDDYVPYFEEVEKETETPKSFKHNILIGCFITAFARDVLLTAIEKIKQSSIAEFWYCDTDSIHFGYKGDKDYIKCANEIIDDIGLGYDPAEFGKWKAEQYIEWGKYLGNKRYWEYDPVLKAKEKDPNVIKGAGIQKVGKEFIERKGLNYFTYDNFNTIVVPFKVSKKVHGGVKIFMDYKEIKPNMWQYEFID